MIFASVAIALVLLDVIAKPLVRLNDGAKNFPRVTTMQILMEAAVSMDFIFSMIETVAKISLIIWILIKGVCVSNRIKVTNPTLFASEARKVSVKF